MNCEKAFMPVRFRKHTKYHSDVKVEDVRRKVRDEEEKSELENHLQDSGRNTGTGKRRLFCQRSRTKPGVLSGG